MLFHLLLLFTIVPLTELWLLIRVSSHIGFGTTLAIVIITGVVGAALAKHEGLRTFAHIQTDLNAGRLPGDRLVDALLILVAGALLITPGIMTDIVGFSLLLPPVRKVIRAYLKKRFKAKFVISQYSPFGQPTDDDFIDVEARPTDDDDDDGRYLNG